MTLETALSDHNKMTNSAEIIFSKKAPVTINYRDYKSFDAHISRNNIRNQLDQLETMDIDCLVTSRTFLWHF